METPTIPSKKILVNSSTKTSLTPCRRVGLSRLSSGSLKKSVHVRTININTPVKCDDDSMLNTSLVKSVTPSNENPSSPKLGENLKVPLKISDAQNKAPFIKVRRCLSVESKNPSNLETPRAKKVCLDNLSRNVNSCDGIKSYSRRKLHSEYESNKQNERLKSNLTSVNCREKIEKNIKIEESPTVATAILSPAVSVTVGKDGNIQEITPEMTEQLALSVIEKKKRLEQLKIQAKYTKKHNLEELRSQTAKWKTAGQEALRHCLSLARHAGYSVTLQDLMSQHGFPQELMSYNIDNDEFD